jgi:hypothetical protein
MAKHSKERTQAEAQFKRTQKAQRATESGQAMADYVAAGQCCSCKDRSVKRTSIGQRGGRQEGQDQARHKIEIAPNLILNARRELVWINVTAHPTAEWIAQQITEAFPWSESPRYLIRDRDAIYGAAVTRRLRAMGIRDKPIAPGSPWQNTFAERLIGSIRRDC